MEGVLWSLWMKQSTLWTRSWPYGAHVSSASREVPPCTWDTAVELVDTYFDCSEAMAFTFTRAVVTSMGHREAFMTEGVENFHR
ncbi:hypothetical protein GUJ93_ZPchr0004g38843 [Zizania palustris]|uniref:Uncharacterized protein n=1 Tax=Zizania palustris TaxID=103762 RepID=A0A8J5SJH7_ZIZPA|nr:hypothetical protein GUJ93_ZPchr0004g38843 [Zizania palustris]